MSLQMDPFGWYAATSKRPPGRAHKSPLNSRMPLSDDPSMVTEFEHVDANDWEVLSTASSNGCTPRSGYVDLGEFGSGFYCKDSATSAGSPAALRVYSTDNLRRSESIPHMGNTLARRDSGCYHSAVAGLQARRSASVADIPCSAVAAATAVRTVLWLDDSFHLHLEVVTSRVDQEFVCKVSDSEQCHIEERVEQQQSCHGPEEPCSGAKAGQQNLEDAVVAIVPAVIATNESHAGTSAPLAEAAAAVPTAPTDTPASVEATAEADDSTTSGMQCGRGSNSTGTNSNKRYLVPLRVLSTTLPPLLNILLPTLLCVLAAHQVIGAVKGSSSTPLQSAGGRGVPPAAPMRACLTVPTKGRCDTLSLVYM